MKRIFTAVLLFLLGFHAEPVLADGKGSTGFNFLKIGVGARQMAMSNCAVAVDGDVNSASYNPATLADVAQQEIGFLHTQYLEEIKYQYAGYVYPHSKYGAFGLTYHNVSYGDIQGYDRNNKRTSMLSPSDTAFGVTYAKTIRQNLQFGITSRYLREDLVAASASAYSFDLGGLYRLPGTQWWSKVAAGAAIRNMGTKATFITEATSLPLEYDLGLSYTDWGGRLVGTFEMRKPTDGNLGFAMGGEVTTRRFLALRAGYRSDKDIAPNFTMGFGLLFWNESLKFDYAFVPYENLTSVHRFGVTYRFGGIAKRHYKEGIRLMRAGRFADAILEFDKVLQQDPNHYMAARYMKLCSDQLKKEE